MVVEGFSPFCFVALSFVAIPVSQVSSAVGGDPDKVYVLSIKWPDPRTHTQEAQNPRQRTQDAQNPRPHTQEAQNVSCGASSIVCFTPARTQA